ncbi:MAG: HAD family phosphatase [Spirochaetales bacterium]|nr:HAD family phosphatase [Spirochaetales bacterium]
MKKAVIFDMDGVLVDSEPLHYESEKTILQTYGLDFTREVHKNYIGYANELKFWQDLCHLYNVELDTSMLMKKKMEYFYAHLDKIVLIEPAKKLLENLHSRKIPLALASSSNRELIDKILGTFSLGHFFKVIQSGDNIKNGKPAPDIFLKTAELISTDPAECIVIEDSLNGVKAGKAAGMTVIAVPNEYTRSFDFSMADYTLESLDEFHKLEIL